MVTFDSCTIGRLGQGAVDYVNIAHTRFTLPLSQASNTIYMYINYTRNKKKRGYMHDYLKNQWVQNEEKRNETELKRKQLDRAYCVTIEQIQNP